MSDATVETLPTPSATTSTPSPDGTGSTTILTPPTTETAPPAPEPQQAPEPAPEPVDYAAALKFPDGFEVDQQTFGAFAQAAGELQLSAEGAQKLADLFVAHEQRVLAAEAARFDAWANEARQSPWLTGEKAPDGGFASLEEVRPLAAAALADLPDGMGKEAWDDLARTGLANKAWVALALARLGKATRPGPLATGGAAAPDWREVLNARYPSNVEK